VPALSADRSREALANHLRFVPDDGALVEVTCRTIQGRLLLRPSPLDDGTTAEDTVLLNSTAADVRLVALYVVVTDRDGRPARGLRRATTRGTAGCYWGVA